MFYLLFISWSKIFMSFAKKLSTRAEFWSDIYFEEEILEVWKLEDGDIFTWRIFLPPGLSGCDTGRKNL